jgi:CRP-like cAMP-binding protein
MDTATDAIQQQILQHLKTIPMFDRLEMNELKKIYGICNYKQYQIDDKLCEFGTPSNDLFILLDGRLVARTKTGLDIAYIPPIGVVGEMGVLTDQPRSADVVAFDESMGFLITKKSLVDMFVEDGVICRKILLNVVKILSAKLYDTNSEIEKLRDMATQGGRASNQTDDIFLY